MRRIIYLIFLFLAGKAAVAQGQDLAEPVRPEKANEKSVVIRLDIDTTSLRELAIYNNLRFEIDPHGRKYDPRDTSETWNKIEIKKAADQPGWYVLTFSNAQRKVAYRARPVFEAEDYAQALKTYEGREAEYRRRRRANTRWYRSMRHIAIVQAARWN